MSRTTRIDMHVHSEYSPDSRLALTEIAEAAVEGGLSGFALTDHQTVRGHPALAELRSRYPQLLVVPGVEAAAREGHVLLYGVAEAPPRGLPVAELIEWAKPRNAVVALAHPFRWIHGVGARVASRVHPTAIEATNGRTSAPANARAELIGLRRHLALIGGSDAHERQTVGRACTELEESVESVESFLEAVRSSRVHPFGESLSFAGRARLIFRVSLLRAARGFRAV